MPEYTFKCKKCSNVFSVFWHVSEYDANFKKCKCSACKSKKVNRDYSDDSIHGSVKEIKTIGQLAEANSKKLGKYGLEERILKDGRIEDKAKKEKRERFRKINKMTKAQQRRWVENGD